jgi:DNA replication protein DnaC
MTFRGFEQMVATVGRRFAGCEFRNFDVGDDQHTEQRRAKLAIAEGYARELRENIAAGRNLLIVGPCGTGKDHLAVSVIRVALGLAVDTVYIRGSDLCSQMRQHYVEHSAAVPDRFGKCELLVVSDIEPSANGSTDFEERAILELLDLRYRDMRPIVATSNLSTRVELEKKLGARAIDRLLHGADVIVTSWPSYRRGARNG